MFRGRIQTNTTDVKLRKRARKGFWVVSAPKSNEKRDACQVTSIDKSKHQIPINFYLLCHI